MSTVRPTKSNPHQAKPNLEDLDHPIYINTGPEEEDVVDGVEEFFYILYHHLR